MKHCPTFNTECGSPLTCCNGCYANPVEQRNSDGTHPEVHFVSLPKWLMFFVYAGAVIGLVVGIYRSV
ncbi:MAG: hypothetical protein V4451_16230 [Pseudomonadota bacterium]